jgi:RNA polymerase sigma-70 factor (ECF subfamily)
MEQRLVTPGEEELICRAVRGDAEAFGDLYMLHLDSIYRYVFHRVADRMEAEDLTEQVFLKAWKAMGRYRHGGSPFSSWLYRIAHNAVIDYYRSSREVQPLDSVSRTLADDALGLEERAIKGSETARLHEAIGLLSAVRQEVIILRFVEGLSHGQVAEILGRSEGAIRVLQHRALTDLSAILKGR